MAKPAPFPVYPDEPDPPQPEPPRILQPDPQAVKLDEMFRRSDAVAARCFRETKANVCSLPVPTQDGMLRIVWHRPPPPKKWWEFWKP